MPLFPDPSDSYWAVKTNPTQVYSSKVGDYVPLTDPGFLTWSADGTKPFSVADEIELGGALAQNLLRPTSAVVLDSYKDKLARGCIDAIQFRIIFNHENRIRAIERALGLNGSPPNLTQQQALAAVKALM